MNWACTMLVERLFQYSPSPHFKGITRAQKCTFLNLKTLLIGLSKIFNLFIDNEGSLYQVNSNIPTNHVQNQNELPWSLHDPHTYRCFRQLVTVMETPPV